ncbi:hypothetical protein FSST1_010565 [Fusarium sambucinum]
MEMEGKEHDLGGYFFCYPVDLDDELATKIDQGQIRVEETIPHVSVIVVNLAKRTGNVLQR